MKFLIILLLVIMATSCGKDEEVLLLDIPETVVAPPLGDILGGLVGKGELIMMILGTPSNQ